MIETKIIVKDVHLDQATGHVTYLVHAESKDGNVTWRGPVKQYGVDPQALRDRFNGSLEEFEAWVAKEHKPYAGVRPGLSEELLKRKGAVIG